MSIVGTRVVRQEDQNLITAGGTYVDDLREEALSGAAHAVFVRSPIAHARIGSIDVSEAKAAPGVLGVFTAADLGLDPHAAGPVKEPWLADGIVRYVGEPVALVLTEERYQLADAAELVDIDYDPLDAVASINAALADETLLYPETGSNVVQVNGAEKFDDSIFEELRSRRVADDREPARRARAARRARRVVRVGRRRPADGLAFHPERPDRPDAAGREPRRRRGAGAGDRAGRRRRLRREDRRRPRSDRARLGGQEPRPRGALGRVAQREPDGDDARPRAAEHRDDRREARRHRPRLPPRRHPGRGRVPADAVPADADRADGRRRLPVPEGGDAQPRGRHEHDADRGLPRRGPPGGDRRARAGDGRLRRRDRDGPGRGPPGQLHPARGVPVPDADRRVLRHRRVRRGAGQGPRGRRVRGPAGRAAAAARSRRRGRNRPRDRRLRRDHRR